MVALAAMLPVAAGLVGILAPAFGHLPALGHRGVSLAPFAALFAAPGIATSVLLSAATGLAATALGVGLTMLLLAASYGGRSLVVAERLLAPILSVPHAAAAAGFVFLFAPTGFVLRLLSPWPSGLEAPPDIALVGDPYGIALVLALAMKETPFLFMMALVALSQVEAAGRVGVARSLGYGRMAAFLHAAWPLVYRQMRLPVLAVLAFAASVVDVVMILGPRQPAPLGGRIVTWLQAADLDGWFLGSAGAVAMMGLVLLLVGLWRAGEAVAGRAAARLRLGGRRWRRDRVARVAVLGFGAVAVAAMAVSFAGLMLQSVAGYWPFPDVLPATVGLAVWQRRLAMAAATLGDTLTIALAATAAALPLAVVLVEAARRGGVSTRLVYVPLIVPQVAFLFGLDVLAIRAGLTPGLGAVILAHMVFALPYQVIALAGPWQALDPRFEAVAASLGAGPVRRFVTVRLAMMTASLLVTAAVSVAVSVGLYLPTQMIGAGRVATVTTEAVAAATGGDRRLLGLYATLQLVIPLLAFAVARWVPALLWRRRRGMRPVRWAA
nr:ABC transporter permease [Acuticoccus mangrovi]